MEKTHHSKGGIMRAKNLSAEDRSKIAKAAATERWNLPVANHYWVLKFWDFELPCSVIEIDWKIQRLIAQREVVWLFTWHLKWWLGRYLQAKNLSNYLPDKFKSQDLESTIIKHVVGWRKTFWYNAEDIVDICSMYLDARRDKALLPTQIQLAEKSEIIVRSLAKVGIISLIDEATWYQTYREKDALQEYLKTVIRWELAAWVKRFPNDFFMQIYRLHKWKYDVNNNKRPQIVWKYINDLVYSRLWPWIKEELQNKNPLDETWKRKSKHHQWLTEDIWNPKLAQHLHTLIKLMELSDDWKQFITMVDRAFPISDPNQLKLLV